MATSDVYSKISESAKANCQFWGHFENRLEKNEKNRIASNKCNICTLDITIDFHWKNKANRWRSEICLISSYVDSLLKVLSGWRHHVCKANIHVHDMARIWIRWLSSVVLFITGKENIWHFFYGVYGCKTLEVQYNYHFHRFYFSLIHVL